MLLVAQVDRIQGFRHLRIPWNPSRTFSAAEGTTADFIIDTVDISQSKKMTSWYEKLEPSFLDEFTGIEYQR